MREESMLSAEGVPDRRGLLVVNDKIKRTNQVVVIHNELVIIEVAARDTSNL